MIAMTSAILPVFIFATTDRQPLVFSEVQVLQCSSTCCTNTRQGINFRLVTRLLPGNANGEAPASGGIGRQEPPKLHFQVEPGNKLAENEPRSQNQCRQLIALPDYYQRDWQTPVPSLPTPPPNIPFQEHAAPIDKPSFPPRISIQKPTQISPPPPRETINPQPTPPTAQPVAPPVVNTPPKLTTDADIIAARRAWQYFERNWNAQTGLVNSVENYPWTTWWDQGSAILGMHAAHQLGLIKTEEFNRKLDRLFQTLERLPLPATGLPNKAYSTNTAQMRRLDNTPDPRGTSGWSALDMGRFLMGLRVLRSHYPQFQPRIDRLVAKWNLSQLVKDGWLQGGITRSNGRIGLVQEGRFGYEQYAAHSLKLWNIEAINALHNPPVQTIQINGVELQIDRRNLSNSGASNYLTSDPYLLWGLELGWHDAIKPHVINLFKVQAKRFETTGILTAVNEDSLDRPPYFLYYSVYANGQAWMPINVEGKSFPHLRSLSTKAAFAWAALMPNEPYAKKLRESVQNLAAPNRGYLAGRYENPRLGVNNAIDVNTNAVVLESLLYQARGGRSLVF